MQVAAEGVDPYHFERRGQVDAAQVGVLLKGLMVKIAQAFGKGDVLKSEATAEGAPADGVESLVEGQRLHVDATEEAELLNDAHTGGDVERLHCVAASEAAVFDAAHAVGDVDRLQGAAHIEGKGANDTHR